MAKKIDPKAKAKRQKVIAAVGGVLLLGLLAFQIPRTLKMLHQQSAAADTTPASSSAAPTATTPLAPPSLDGSGSSAGAGAGSSAAAVATSKDGVVDPDAPLPPAAGQLVSFGRFRGKDPFAQQISTDCVPVSGDAPNSCRKAAKPLADAKRMTGGSTVTVGKTTTPTSPAAALTEAAISINGAPQRVALHSTFPASNPVFVLVALTSTTAKIGLAGGSFDNGASTVKLVKGRTLTLMNTADGTRYALRLLAVR